MSWYLLLKLAHILCVIALLSGVIGRGLVRRRIPMITSIQVLQEIMALVGRFDQLLVIRGSLLTLVTGLLVGWAGGWPPLVSGHPTWISLSVLLFLSQLPFVFLVFIPRGKQFGKVFQVALAEQQITPELRAALADRAVRAATIYESVTFGLILGLMVLKPF
jgi:hypothetical protein